MSQRVPSLIGLTVVGAALAFAGCAAQDVEEGSPEIDLAADEIGDWQPLVGSWQREDPSQPLVHLAFTTIRSFTWPWGSRQVAVERSDSVEHHEGTYSVSRQTVTLALPGEPATAYGYEIETLRDGKRLRLRDSAGRVVYSFRALAEGFCGRTIHCMMQDLATTCPGDWACGSDHRCDRTCWEPIASEGAPCGYLTRELYYTDCGDTRLTCSARRVTSRSLPRSSGVCLRTSR